MSEELQAIGELPRADDGYVNVTPLCRARGVTWYTYARSPRGRAVMDALADGNPRARAALVRTLRGGVSGAKRGKGQGTWVHPDLALDIAQWLNPAATRLLARAVRQPAAIDATALARHAADQYEVIAHILRELAGRATTSQVARVFELTEAWAESGRRALGAVNDAVHRRIDRVVADKADASTVAAVVERVRLLEELLNPPDRATILAFTKAHGIKLAPGEARAHGRELARLCRLRGITLDKVRDDRYDDVLRYPVAVLREYYNVPPPSAQ
jgi:hypothetical protein